MAYKRLTAGEFDRAISTVRRSMTDENVEIARAVLVDGRKQKDFVITTGAKTRSAMMISNVVTRVWGSHLENGLPPEGWERFEVCLPSELVPIVKRMEMDAKERYEHKV
jgi:hypothetical protein